LNARSACARVGTAGKAKAAARVRMDFFMNAPNGG
jgi:hypothetical protein